MNEAIAARRNFLFHCSCYPFILSASLATLDAAREKWTRRVGP